MGGELRETRAAATARVLTGASPATACALTEAPPAAVCALTGAADTPHVTATAATTGPAAASRLAILLVMSSAPAFPARGRCSQTPGTRTGLMAVTLHLPGPLTDHVRQLTNRDHRGAPEEL